MNTDNMTDQEILKMVLGASAVHSSAEKDEETKKMSQRVSDILLRCINMINEESEVKKRIANLEESLRAEKATARRIKTIVQNGAKILEGNPKNYPAHMQKFVYEIQTEALR
jgi:hypothetical protein